ncbi:MAG: histidine phosphatase family protein [Halieaceae bacterium]|jgi:phosphohistidine phosphatase|nr:histidine phosphatase family protein [Halieaceae bacterium]
MIITVWRHGEAGSAATDRQRELTDTGFDDVGFGCRQFHAALEARGMTAPELILFSPWLRTRETADVIAAAFTHARSRELDALRPASNVAALEAVLADMESGPDSPRHVVLVSHQPLVSQLVDHYLGATNPVPPLSPGGLVTLSLEVAARGCGELCFWAMPPGYEAGI